MNVTNNPETNKLFAELAACGFDIDNEKIVNKNYAHESGEQRTDLDWIIGKLNSEADTMTEHQKEKAAKAARIALYAAQIEAGQEQIDYDVDEQRQYAAELRFAKYAGLGE